MMIAKLIAQEEKAPVPEIRLEKETKWTIGRDPDQSTIVIEDPKVSRKHILCEKTSEGFFIENLSQTNPAQLNNQDLTQKMPLKAKDVVRFGSFTYLFTLEESTQGPTENTQVSLEESSSTDSSVEEKEKPSEPLSSDSDQPSAPFLPPEDTSIPAKTSEELTEDYEEIFEEDDSGFADFDLDLSRSSRFLLKVISGPNTGAEFGIEPGNTYLIGTDNRSCNILFFDLSVSKQHAKIEFTQEQELWIENLQSKNGVFVDGQKIETRTRFEFHTTITLGTTTFIIIDTEGHQETIVSIPQELVQKQQQKKEDLVQKEEDKKRQKEMETLEKLRKDTAVTPVLKTILGTFLVVLILVLSGTLALFKSNAIQTPEINYEEEIGVAIHDYPGVQYAYNPNSGRLLLTGNVLTVTESEQLLYSLQNLPFINTVVNDLIIDENVWNEMNQVLNKKPGMQAVSMKAVAPGQYVINGYLKTQAEAEELQNYLNQRFSYMNKLDYRVIVEESIQEQIASDLIQNNFNGVAVKTNSGEVTFSGFVSSNVKQKFTELVEQVKQVPGVRTVRNFVVELAPEQSIINLSNKYQITGYTSQDGVNINVVIGGKILSRGDLLDGMTITSIRPDAVFLEKDGFKYRIDYNK